MDKLSARSYPEQCRVSYFIDDFWICSVNSYEQITSCPHAYSFGFRHYCRHPERGSFMSQISKERQHKSLSL